MVRIGSQSSGYSDEVVAGILTTNIHRQTWSVREDCFQHASGPTDRQYISSARGARYQLILFDLPCFFSSLLSCCELRFLQALTYVQAFCTTAPCSFPHSTLCEEASQAGYWIRKTANLNLGPMDLQGGVWHMSPIRMTSDSLERTDETVAYV